MPARRRHLSRAAVVKWGAPTSISLGQTAITSSRGVDRDGAPCGRPVCVRETDRPHRVVCLSCSVTSPAAGPRGPASLVWPADSAGHFAWIPARRRGAVYRVPSGGIHEAARSGAARLSPLRHAPRATLPAALAARSKPNDRGRGIKPRPKSPVTLPLAALPRTQSETEEVQRCARAVTPFPRVLTRPSLYLYALARPSSPKSHFSR